MDDNRKQTDHVAVGEDDHRDIEQAVPAQHESDEKDHELVTIATTASERLPFSKVRCFALVATVAAAPYLTVRISHTLR